VTLIAACLTPSYIVQASDRRLTELPSGRLVEDNRNKVVQLGANMAIGFTGLAEIEGLPTDEWMLEVLGGSLDAEGDRFKALLALRDRATEAFGRIRLPAAYKRHAFQVAGWGRFSGNEVIEPFIYLISNFAGPGHWLAEAKPGFELTRQRPGTSTLALCSAGQKMGFDRLTRDLVHVLERGAGPAAAARLLAEAVRDVAETNPAVGKAVLVNVLPKPDPDRPPTMQSGTAIPPLDPQSRSEYFASAVSDSEPSYVFVPADLGSPPVAYGPALVSAGMRMKGAEFGLLPEGAAPFS